MNQERVNEVRRLVEKVQAATEWLHRSKAGEESQHATWEVNETTYRLGFYVFTHAAELFPVSPSPTTIAELSKSFPAPIISNELRACSFLPIYLIVSRSKDAAGLLAGCLPRSPTSMTG